MGIDFMLDPLTDEAAGLAQASALISPTGAYLTDTVVKTLY